MSTFRLASFVIVVLSANALGCTGATGDGAGDAGPSERVIELQFAAMVGDAAFSCSDADGARQFANLGSSGSTASFKDFRFYVSNVRLEDADGASIPFTLEASRWQHDGVALLDFEDGTGDCVDIGNADLNSVVRGTAAEGEVAAVSFDLGIPFDKNHLDASSGETPPPLNIMSLYWSWQAGHKFARVDLNVEGRDGWNVHLGSTGCVSNGSAEAPDTQCAKPNVATVAVDGFDPQADTIVFDAAALLEGADLTVNNDGPPGCQSFPADVDDCPEVFARLGLDFASGACANGCADQTAFSVLEGP